MTVSQRPISGVRRARPRRFPESLISSLSTERAGLATISAAVVIAVVLALASRRQLDFEVYRMGGAHVLGSHLYSATLPSKGLLFTYTPFAALLFLPLAHVALLPAQVVWALLNCGALLMLVALSIKAAKRTVLTRGVWMQAVVLTTPALTLEPVYLTMFYGQVNLFIVVMVVSDLTCVIGRNDRTLPRGVLVGVAAAIKLTPLIFVPFLFLTRQFRAGLCALASFLGCIVATFAIAPRASWTYWTKDALDARRAGNTWFVGNQNLVGAIERLVGHTTSSVVVIGLTLVFAVCGLTAATVAYRKSSSLLGIVVCGATGLIISPISWTHHYVWIVPVLAWLMFAPDRPQGARWWTAATAIFFVIPPMAGVPINLHHYSGPVQYAEGNGFFFAAVILLVATTAMVWHRNRITRTNRSTDASIPICSLTTTA